MGIFRNKPPTIKEGDRFIKASDRLEKVWEVLKLWTSVDGVPHARLVHGDETLAVSIITLSDPQFFVHAPASISDE